MASWYSTKVALYLPLPLDDARRLTSNLHVRIFLTTGAPSRPSSDVKGQKTALSLCSSGPYSFEHRQPPSALARGTGPK